MGVRLERHAGLVMGRQKVEGHVRIIHSLHVDFATICAVMVVVSKNSTRGMSHAPAAHYLLEELSEEHTV